MHLLWQCRCMLYLIQCMCRRWVPLLVKFSWYSLQYLICGWSKIYGRALKTSHAILIYLVNQGNSSRLVLKHANENHIICFYLSWRFENDPFWLKKGRLLKKQIQTLILHGIMDGSERERVMVFIATFNNISVISRQKMFQNWSTVKCWCIYGHFRCTL